MPAISKLHDLHSESDVNTLSSTLEKLPCGCPIQRKKTDFGKFNLQNSILIDDDLRIHVALYSYLYINFITLDLVLLESLHIALRSLADNLSCIPLNLLEFQAYLHGMLFYLKQQLKKSISC